MNWILSFNFGEPPDVPAVCNNDKDGDDAVVECSNGNDEDNIPKNDADKSTPKNSEVNNLSCRESEPCSQEENQSNTVGNMSQRKRFKEYSMSMEGIKKLCASCWLIVHCI